MENIIQSAILSLFPTFKIEWIALLPAVALVLVGWKVETHYISKLKFFLNSVTLMSYYGLKSEINPLIGLLVLVFFCLTTWSFLAYAFNLPKIEKYEEFINKKQTIMKFGGSFFVGIILLLDYFI